MRPARGKWDRIAARVNVLWAILGLVGGMASAPGMRARGSSRRRKWRRARRRPGRRRSRSGGNRAIELQDVVTRGTVRFGLPQPISIAPSQLKGGVGLIASLPRPNTGFREGEIILSVSGRPVFILQGATPVHRDISPGISGGDVLQLEQALARLGFDPGPVDGVYDKTSAAVERFYRKAGWDAHAPTREQRAAVLALEREWSDAVRGRLAAESARETALRAVAAARALADQNTRQAALDVAARGGNPRRSGDVQANPSLALDAERARAAHAQSAAAADVAAQIAERAIIVLDPRQTETARATAEARLNVARAAQRKARLEADVAIQNAKREADLGQERIQLAEAAVKAARLEGERSVRAALEQQTLAEFDLKVASERTERAERELTVARENSACRCRRMRSSSSRHSRSVSTR